MLLSLSSFLLNLTSLTSWILGAVNLGRLTPEELDEGSVEKTERRVELRGRLRRRGGSRKWEDDVEAEGFADAEATMLVCCVTTGARKRKDSVASGMVWRIQLTHLPDVVDWLP